MWEEALELYLTLLWLYVLPWAFVYGVLVVFPYLISEAWRARRGQA